MWFIFWEYVIYVWFGVIKSILDKLIFYWKNRKLSYIKEFYLEVLKRSFLFVIIYLDFYYVVLDDVYKFFGYFLVLIF